MGFAAVLPAVLTAVSTAVSYLGNKAAANAQSAQLKYQAAQSRADAEAEKGAAQVQAEKIRKLGRIKAAEANASLASSGVDINAGGTAYLINEDIYKTSEQDALTTIMNGSNTSSRINAQATAYDIESSNVKTANKYQTTASLLSMGSSVASGWKGSSKTSGGGSSGGIKLKSDPWGNI